MFTAGTSLSHDSNVFRLPDSADVRARTGSSSRADDVLSAYAGIRLDKPYAQQRFQLDASATAYRHARFKQLDFDALQYRGAWQWHLTPRVSGSLSADRSQSLVNYADFANARQRNVQTTESQAASAEAQLGAGWRVLGGLEQRDSRTTTPIADVGSFRSEVAHAGLKYGSLAGNTLALIGRRQEGRYVDRPVDPVNLLGDRFTREEVELVEDWTLSGRSSLAARLAHVAYREEPFSERDFSGTEARLAWRWSPLGRLSTSLELARLLTPWRDASATYRAENRVVLGAAWQLAARLSASASASTGTSRFYRPIVPPPEARKDVARSVGAGLEWQLRRYATLSASLSREARDSSLPGFDYRATVATLSASLAF